MLAEPLGSAEPRLTNTALDCVGLAESIHSSVIRIIHRNVGLKCFFHLLKCLLLSIGFLTFMFHKVV